MNSFLKISALAATTAMICVSAQAQQLDNAQAEVSGIPLTPITVKTSTAGAVLSGLTRGVVIAEFERARAAGELDFAYAEVNGALPQRGSVRAGDLRQAQRGAK